MERLAIKSVYWVDDENATAEEMSVDRLALVVAEELEKSEALQRKKALGKLNAIESARKLAAEIEGVLTKRNVDDVIEAICNLFASKLNSAVDDPVKILTEMLSVLPQPLKPEERAGLIETFKNHTGWNWEEMSFARWNAEHSKILSTHTNGGGNALLIVDLQNSRESSLLSGKDVLNQWAQQISLQEKSVPIFAVAFTSQFTKDKELLEGRKFTKELFEEKDAPALPVLVLSKDRLSKSGTNELPGSLVEAAFVNALSRLRAYTLHGSLADELQATLATSTKSAFSKLQQLSIEELVYAVSSTSFREGASEIETLIRMISIAQREALLAGVMGSMKIPAELLELRGLNEQIGLVTYEELESIEGIENLRCSELHEPAGVVNTLLSPLAAGDIFEVQHNAVTAYHVLVSNACDLMLRGSTGTRKLQLGLLLPLEVHTGSKEKLEQTFFDLHFPKDSPLANQSLAVNLQRISPIPLEVLDLSWTNPEGVCRWSWGQYMPPGLALLPSQLLRYKKIHKDLEDIHDLEGIKKFASGSDFQHEFVGNPANLVRIEFPFRRIGRLSSTVAADLIQRFAQVLARPSRGHDFSARPK